MKLIKFGFKFGCRLTLQHPVKKLTWLRGRLHLADCASTFLVSSFLFFFFSAHMNNNYTVHAHGFTVQELHLAYCASTFLVSLFFFQRIWIVTTLFMHMDSLCKRQSALFTRPTTTLFRKQILKTGTTALSTHLKIILWQCFQFSVFSKISYFRTDLTYLENLTIDHIFFIFSTHMPNFVIIGYCLLYGAQTYF